MNDKVREALEKAFKAISSLPIDCLGYGEDDAGRWPLRDELMEEMDKALSSDPWQPIETAPRDGSIIVAYNSLSHSDNKYETVLWSDSKWRPRKDTSITYPSLSHWQPLPAPPKE